MLKEFEGVNVYVVKVASRCNLNCSYCYMYNMGDQTYLKQPKFITLDIISEFSSKLKNHILKYKLKSVDISFHGGEPLLWGSDNIIKAKNIIENIIKNDVDVLTFAIQTNGVLLTETMIKKFKDEKISIGVSLDGLKDNHDKYRVDHKGEGSFETVIKNFPLLRKYQEELAIISVVNLEISPIEYLLFLKEHNVTSLNLILPDSTHDKLPEGYSSLADTSSRKYGKWLATFFDSWISGFETNPIRINLLETIIGLLSGRNFKHPMFGDGYNKVAVLESDGALEVADYLRVTESGYTRNRLTIGSNEIDELTNDESFITHYFAKKNLCNTCKSCELEKICKGGDTQQRYKSTNGFDNPSMFCKDIKFIINHINNYLKKQIEVI